MCTRYRVCSICTSNLVFFVAALILEFKSHRVEIVNFAKKKDCRERLARVGTIGLEWTRDRRKG